MSHILLVEDNDAATAWIAKCIAALSSTHHLAAFPTAAGALSHARENRVDLFILDIQLLDYRGTELAKQLRAMPEYRFTPILFTTELSGEELSAYREIKCYDFLVKPFTEAEFSRAFLAALDLGRHMQAAPAVLRIEQKQFVFEYEYRQILYLESFGKRVVIHTLTDGGRTRSDSVTGYSRSTLLEAAGPERLVHCHKRFLVNPARIHRIDKGSRLLYLNGCEAAIPIGEKYQQNLLGHGG